jgi:hypothetical protein
MNEMKKFPIDNSTVAELVKKFSFFMYFEILLPSSEHPATEHCHEPDEYGLQPYTLFP